MLDTLSGFADLAEKTPAQNLVAWVNEFFGPVTHNGKSFSEMAVVKDHISRIRGVVRKTRYLYLVGETRVHLDDVEGLGQFMELEVVMQEGQSDAEGQAIAEGLMASLGVESSDLLEGAYMDLLESSVHPNDLSKNDEPK
jgi:hypothetical protein